MPVTTAADRSLVTVHVDGAIDSQLGAALQTATTTALAEGKPLLLVNLQRAKQANSAGLEALVAAARAVNKAGGRIALVGPSPLLADILKATRLDQRLAVFESTEQAITGLRREA